MMNRLIEQWTRPSYMLGYRPNSNTVLYLEGQQDAYSSTIRDLSGYNNRGTITGATWVRLPGGLWVMSFDGTDDVVTILDAGGVLASANMAVKIWIKPTVLNDNNCIIGKKATTYNQANGWQIYVNTTTSRIGVRGSDGTERLSSVVSPLNIWSMLTVTFIGAVAHCYLNGLSISTDLAITTVATNADACRIGKLSDDYPSWWQGYGGLPVITTPAPSASQIYNTYQNERSSFGV